MNVQENEPLSRHTTFRAGGPARFFVEATSDAAIQHALAFATERQLPVFVLGGGSNVLVSDDGFNGVVVKVATRGIQTSDLSSGLVEVVAEAGEEWDAVVAFAVERDLSGLENMSLIPGKVGAAVVGNIGAYGAEIKDSLLWVDALDLRNGAVRRFLRADCAFGYRRSFFKTPEGRRHLVMRAGFSLKRNGPLNTAYKDVQSYFAGRGVTAPTLAGLREAVIAIRRRKLPDLACVGTAGSFFKNPVIPRAAYEALAARHPHLPGYDEGDGLVKVPLGWILDKICGLKGIRRGLVGTHSEQALVIVNEGGTAGEIEAFAHEITRTVHQHTGIVIEWEVEKVG